jgi:hypothetical protein
MQVVDTGPWGRAAGFVEPLGITRQAWLLAMSDTVPESLESPSVGVLVMARYAYQRLGRDRDQVSFPARIPGMPGNEGTMIRLVLHRHLSADGRSHLVIKAAGE